MYILDLSQAHHWPGCHTACFDLLIQHLLCFLLQLVSRKYRSCFNIIKSWQKRNEI
ncbi:hypothetical protein Leryth_023331 [Lithospermum erythrorhizon]|nr:hypothetical protein Leryth_023331 [Lithospermum erythrorhizon]